MAVAPEHLSRAKRLNRSTGLKPTEIAHAGFIREIERLEQQASPVTPKEAKTIEAFKKVTGSADITPVLAAAMRDYVQREAGGRIRVEWEAPGVVKVGANSQVPRLKTA